MTTSIGLSEARANLGQIAKRAACGEDIVITDRGTALVRLVPAQADRDGEALKVAYERFKVIRRKAVLNPPGMPRLDLKELRREPATVIGA